jgi:DNA-binding transcriptional regulator YiaG
MLRYWSSKTYSVPESFRVKVMRNCKACGGLLVPKPIDDHTVEPLGIEGTVVSSVVITEGAHSMQCEKCGEHDLAIVINMPGLIAAVALTRVKSPVKLTGGEIQFLRQAIGMSSKDFAELVGKSTTSVWNWETSKAPMGTAEEKLLRLKVVSDLAKKAPLIVASDAAIQNMKIVPAQSAQAGMVMRFRTAVYNENEEWAEVRKAA